MRSGGILFEFRENLVNHVQILENECEFVLWVQIDGKVFNLEQPVIFGQYIYHQNILDILHTINNWFALQKLSNIFPYLFLILSIFLRFSGIFRFSKIPA
jgi:hypothetical protein